MTTIYFIHAALEWGTIICPEVDVVGTAFTSPRVFLLPGRYHATPTHLHTSQHRGIWLGGTVGVTRQAKAPDGTPLPWRRGDSGSIFIHQGGSPRDSEGCIAVPRTFFDPIWDRVSSCMEEACVDVFILDPRGLAPNNTQSLKG